MRFVILLAAIVVSTGAGCAHVAVYVEHDPTANFKDLTTYGWLNEPSTGDSPTAENSILDARVHAIVEDGLAAHGYEKATDGTPDFLVGYSAAVEETLQGVTIDRYYGYTQTTYLTKSGSARDYPRGTMGRQTVVYEYQQGSLILDISTPQPRKLIWRGFARAAIEPDETQKQRDTRLREAVRQLLKQFPPR